MYRVPVAFYRHFCASCDTCVPALRGCCFSFASSPNAFLKLPRHMVEKNPVQDTSVSPTESVATTHAAKTRSRSRRQDHQTRPGSKNREERWRLSAGERRRTRFAAQRRNMKNFDLVVGWWMHYCCREVPAPSRSMERSTSYRSPLWNGSR